MVAMVQRLEHLLVAQVTWVQLPVATLEVKTPLNWGVFSIIQTGLL